MAILLKELTVRYTPNINNSLQIFKDYYAMFTVWKKEGSGGQEITNQRRTELVDDVFEQVVNVVAELLNDRYNVSNLSIPEIKKMNHALKTKNWLDFHAAIEPLIKTIWGTWNTAVIKKSELDPTVTFKDLSPAIKNLVRKFIPRSTTEPTPKDPIASVPSSSAQKITPTKWTSVDKPLAAPQAAIQRDLPMAGAQGDLPLQPREKLPPMPDNLPPLGSPMKGEPKRVGKNWEDSLSKFGYNWSEADNAYKNEQRNVMFQIQPDNSVKVFFPGGRETDIVNLGTLLRRLIHNRNKRHNKKEGEPQAHVTQENYKMLYEFLYS